MIEKVITYAEANQRIDKYVRKALNDAPLSFIYKLFRKKDVKINGKPVKIDYKINEGEMIRIYVTDEQLEAFLNPQSLEGRDFPFPIIYEDENILIVNKPENILVHSDSENIEGTTLTDHVLRYLVYKNEYNPRIELGFTPGPAHRLDRNTTGIVVFGKNVAALQELNFLFRQKEELDKYYIALVAGRLKKDGEIEARILKDPNKNISVVSNSRDAKYALTKYHILQTFEDTTLLNVQIITGRTHQIRVHTQSIGHPVVGDAKYGNFDFNRQFKKDYGYDGIFLHAAKIVFKNVGGNLTYLRGQEFVAPLDHKKEKVINLLKKEKSNGSN